MTVRGHVAVTRAFVYNNINNRPSYIHVRNKKEKNET